MNFDATITLGAVLQTAAMVAAIVVAYIKVRERLMAIETRLDVQKPMWSWWIEHRQQEREDWQKHVDGRIDHAVRGAVQAALWQARRREEEPGG